MFYVALGTHASSTEFGELLTTSVRFGRLARPSELFGHRWRQPTALCDVGHQL